MATVVSDLVFGSLEGLVLGAAWPPGEAEADPVALTADSALPRLPPLAREPLGEREAALTEVTEGALDGTRTLALDPRRSPRAGLSNLLSLNNEAFIRRGLGVLKMDRFSRKRALEKSRRTTQMIMNMSAKPASTPIIAGSKAPGPELPDFETQL